MLACPCDFENKNNITSTIIMSILSVVLFPSNHHFLVEHFRKLNSYFALIKEEDKLLLE